MPNDPTLYRGTAAYYAHGRPPYSRALVSTLASEVGLDGAGRLLDVGCGPGVLTLALADKFAEALGPDRRAGQGVAALPVDRHEDALARTRFGSPRRIFCAGCPDIVQDIDGVLANYFSTSFAAPHLFGDRLADFAADVRVELAPRSMSGLFWDWPGDTEILLARKAA